ncbi:MAG: hypothetical protein J2O46_00545 [Nocardioides sp.]|nr:hypothetical protein [Nocardioides sp.]
MTSPGRPVDRPPHRLRRAAVGTAAALAGIGLLSAGLTGCAGEPKKPAAAHSPPPSPAPPPVVHSTARIIQLQGKLDVPHRQALDAAVTKTVDTWLQAAYVAGTFPRPAATYSKVIFAGWSPGAVAKAIKQYPLLSNAAIAPQIRGVRPISSLIGVDVLANKGVAIGVSADIRFIFDTAGPTASRETISGRLTMTPNGAGWQIFSYDIARSSQPKNPPSPAASPSAPAASPSGGKS